MRYWGSKRRIATAIVPIMVQERKAGQYWVEPFVGGANVIQYATDPRIGADANRYVIALFRALQSGWIPPEEITREEYNAIKANPDAYPPQLWAFAYVTSSFYGKPEAFRDDRSHFLYARRAMMNQLWRIATVEFRFSDYRQLDIPENSLIYCDPPYKGTDQRYGLDSRFDSLEFWQWCRDKANSGHTVFVSELKAPGVPWIKEVWKKEVYQTVYGDVFKRVERLFRVLPG